MDDWRWFNHPNLLFLCINKPLMNRYDWLIDWSSLCVCLCDGCACASSLLGCLILVTTTFGFVAIVHWIWVEEERGKLSSDWWEQHGGKSIQNLHIKRRRWAFLKSLLCVDSHSWELPCIQENEKSRSNEKIDVVSLHYRGGALAQLNIEIGVPVTEIKLLVLLNILKFVFTTLNHASDRCQWRKRIGRIEQKAFCEDCWLLQSEKLSSDEYICWQLTFIWSGVNYQTKTHAYDRWLYSTMNISVKYNHLMNISVDEYYQKLIIRPRLVHPTKTYICWPTSTHALLSQPTVPLPHPTPSICRTTELV